MFPNSLLLLPLPFILYDLIDDLTTSSKVTDNSCFLILWYWKYCFGSTTPGWLSSIVMYCLLDLLIYSFPKKQSYSGHMPQLVAFSGGIRDTWRFWPRCTEGTHSCCSFNLFVFKCQLITYFFFQSNVYDAFALLLRISMYRFIKKQLKCLTNDILAGCDVHLI